VGLIFLSGNTNKFTLPEGAGPFCGRDYITETVTSLPREAYLIMLFNNSYLLKRTSKKVNRPNALEVPGYHIFRHMIVGQNRLKVALTPDTTLIVNDFPTPPVDVEYEAFIYAPQHG